MSKSKRLWDKGQGLHSQVHRFTVGNDYLLDRELAAYDAAASAAHARMLHKIGILTAEECTQLLSELAAIAESSRRGEFKISPDQEDCHTSIEQLLSERVGEAGKKIHTGRSRNDQVLVAQRLYVREQMILHFGLLEALLEKLMHKSKEEIGRPLPGYTHMQRAMPTTVATQLLSYAEYVASLLFDGLAMYQSINWNPLGVGSGFGVPLELDRELTSELLGFAAVQPNPIFVQSTRGREDLKYVGWLIDIASLIEKCAADLMLFSTAEYDLVTLPVEFTTGSSIMPQKRNPDVLELLRAGAGRLRGMRAEIEGVISKLPSSYHRDLQYIKEPLFRASQESFKALEIFILIFADLEFKSQNAEKVFGEELFSTHYAYQLVEQGMAFRDAYLQAAEKLETGNLDISGLKSQFLAQESARTEAELEMLAERVKDLFQSISRVTEAHRASLTSVFQV